MANLFAYGIADEQSDIRAHVCVQVRRIYVYATEDMKALLKRRTYPEKSAEQDSVITARGYLVPPFDIPTCREFQLPPALWEKYRITLDMPPDVRGRIAERLVYVTMREAIVAIPLQTKTVADRVLQQQGHDIAVRFSGSVQVKCDYRGGRRDLGGTGNLFIQIAELNPKKLY